MSNAVRHQPALPPAPLTPAVVRRLLGWSQVKVAAMAGTSTGTVRIFELDPDALSPEKRVSLDAVYASMRSIFLSR